MSDAIVFHRGRPWLRHRWAEGAFPLCLYCGVQVVEPSHDGPLVCGLCDMGWGPSGKWDEAQWLERRSHLRSALLDIRLTQTQADRAWIRALGGDPYPETAPDLDSELEAVRGRHAYQTWFETCPSCGESVRVFQATEPVSNDCPRCPHVVFVSEPLVLVWD